MMNDLNEALSKMRKGNAKRFAEWILSGHETFTYLEASKALGIEREKLEMCLINMKRLGFSFESEYKPSGKWGGNEKVHTFIGVNVEKETEPKSRSLWDMVLSI